MESKLRSNFCYLKIIHILNKCVCIYEIIRLIVMKMKMKNRSHRYGIDDDDAYMH